MHADGMSKEQKLRLRATTASVADYVRFPGIAGCQVKMLAGFRCGGCVSNPLDAFLFSLTSIWWCSSGWKLPVSYLSEQRNISGYMLHAEYQRVSAVATAVVIVWVTGHARWDIAQLESIPLRV